MICLNTLCTIHGPKTVNMLGLICLRYLMHALAGFPSGLLSSYHARQPPLRIIKLIDDEESAVLVETCLCKECTWIPVFLFCNLGGRIVA